MIEDILSFFHMGGYGWYVFSAYGCVISFLLVQWFFPWRRLQQYLRDQYHEQNP